MSPLIVAADLAPVLSDLLPFAAAAAGSLLVSVPDGSRLHLRRPHGRRREPACGACAAGRWMASSPEADPRHLCRRCLPAQGAVAWASSVLEQQPEAIAQGVADGVIGAGLERLEVLQSIVVHAVLMRQRVQVLPGRSLLLHELLAERRRELTRPGFRIRHVRDVQLPPMPAVTA